MEDGKRREYGHLVKREGDEDREGNERSREEEDRK